MSLRIGEVAAQAGVSVQTVRYYERRGLLAQSGRRPSGYRDYQPFTVDIVLFIKRAQELGFTLTEIQELLALREDHTARCTEVRRRTQMKIADIDQRIRNLNAMKCALAILMKSCTSNESIRLCPIIESLREGRTRKKGSTK